jgi:hypothetical protein
MGQKLQTVHLGHVDVAEDNLDVRVVAQNCARFQTVAGKVELILSVTDFPPEMLSHQRFNGSFVINAQYLYSGHGLIIKFNRMIQFLLAWGIFFFQLATQAAIR